MEEWTSGVKSAIAAVILVIIIGIVMVYLNLGYISSENSKETISGQLSGLSEKMFQPYNNRTVTGADALAAIEQFRGTDIGVLVEFAAAAPETVIGPGILADSAWGINAMYHYALSGGKLQYKDSSPSVYNKTSSLYINPTGKYQAVVCKTQAGTIIGICFYKN